MYRDCGYAHSMCYKWSPIAFSRYCVLSRLPCDRSWTLHSHDVTDVQYISRVVGQWGPVCSYIQTLHSHTPVLHWRSWELCIIYWVWSILDSGWPWHRPESFLAYWSAKSILKYTHSLSSLLYSTRSCIPNILRPGLVRCAWIEKCHFQGLRND